MSTQLLSDKARARKNTWRRARQSWQLYLMLLVPIIFLAIFVYMPMAGVQIAFRQFNPVDGIWGSPWVGFQHFIAFFQSYQFWNVISNTLILHIAGLIVGFPLPIILAVMLSHIARRWFANGVQMITYAPYFISVVALVGIIFLAVDPSFGYVSKIWEFFGQQPPDFISDPAWFRPMYILSGVWQSTGFAAVIYLAALSGIDPNLHEAARVDGASLLRRIWHIDIPGIMPVISITLLLNLASILSVGYEKVLLFQRPSNYSVSEVIDTYVYKIGFTSQVPQYSYAAAVGVFQSVVGLILLITTNWIVRRTSKGNEFF